MILTVDIGNTNITMGGYENGELSTVFRLATDVRETADQYAVEINSLLSLKGIEKDKIDDAIICSVVPATGYAVFNALKEITGKDPLVLGPGVKTGLNIKIENPAQLGADLAAGAVGAMDKYPLPCIVIDMGTATTVSVLGKGGEFLGGTIAAGIRSTLDALTSQTAQLPEVSIEAPKSVIGKNTVDCMRSGLVIGAAAMLDGIVERIEETLKEKASVVATGGLSELVVKHCKCRVITDQNLLLEGLYKIYLKNK